MGDFLLTSLVASLILTVALNLGLRFWPRRPGPIVRSEDDPRHPEPPTDHDRPRSVQVYFPWKAMLAISLLLTVVVNVVAFLAR